VRGHQRNRFCAAGWRKGRRPGRAGFDAVARPLGIRLTGPVAELVTRGCHLYALPAMSNRIRVALDWALQTLLPPDETQLSVVREEDARLASAQATAIYRPAGAPSQRSAG
jgi:NADH:ubiquinone reductase (H+-translocating)